MLLAVDTATSTAGVALYDGQVRAELTWTAGRAHSTQVLVQIEHLLKLASVEREELRALGVATGPGSYTGLRVGLSIVQGLAWALGLPSYGVGTLDILAAGLGAGQGVMNHAPTETNLAIQPVLELGRGRFATARYSIDAGRLWQAGQAQNVTLDELVAMVQTPVLLCGDLGPEERGLLEQALPEALLASPAASLRRPAFLAQQAWQLFLEEAPGDPSMLEPIYLTRS